MILKLVLESFITMGSDVWGENVTFSMLNLNGKFLKEIKLFWKRVS